jgi:hypothetical protein
MTVGIGDRERPKDLPAAVFLALASSLFDQSGLPAPFSLPDKRNTQDDPLDRHIGELLRNHLPNDLYVILSGKPLVSPDMIVARPEEYALLRNGGEDLDQRAIVALEVKKLEFDPTGKAARGSGMDYNSTPPCEVVKVIADDKRSELLIPAYYLFVTLDILGEGVYQTSTLALVSGAALNRDVELYKRITGVRQKSIGLGSYGDGADRQRPMLIFANPLGWLWLTGAATLISEKDNLESEQPIIRTRQLIRSVPNGADEIFHCYRLRHLANGIEPPARDPFPTPKRRTTETVARGRFVISFDRALE